MYYLGLGVQMNLVAAHMWFDLAAVQGNQDALPLRDLTEQRMTPAQITEAQKLARGWKPTPER
jgi:TPR repeat protein